MKIGCGMLLILLLLVAIFGRCNSTTQYGKCIGAFDDKDPKLVYKVDKWNVFMAIAFSAFIVPPIVVVADETLCPVGRK